MKPKNTARRIGILDWGIGGLGVFKEFQKKFGSFQCLYVSDSGYTPYGKVSEKKLVQRLNQIAAFFRQNDIDTVVIACNAASTVKDKLQIKNPDMKFWGMLEAGNAAILQSNKKNVLVLGGRRTIESNYFQKKIDHSKYRLQCLVAQPLSAMIEQGLQRTSRFSDEVKKLARKIDSTTESVLLACTHYPAASPIFKKVFKGAVILDPAENLVENFAKSQWRQKSGNSLFITTGSAKDSEVAAKKAFGIKNIQFTKVQIL
jgi:glutamate racemase